MKGKKSNDILILVLFIIVVCGLGGLLVRDRFVSGNGFTPERPHLWIWCPKEYNTKKWSSFYSRSNTDYVPDYIKMCIETIKRHNTNFDIHVLSEGDLGKYVPKAVLDDLAKKNSDFCYDTIVTHVLSKYGGIWMPASTMVFKNLSPLYYHVVDNNLHFGGFSCDSDEYFCLNSDKPDRAIFIAPPKSPVIHEWRNQIAKYNLNAQNDYTFNKRGMNTLRSVLSKYPSKIHLFDASMNGTRDCRLKLIGAESLLSSNIGSLADPRHLYLLNFDRNDIKNNHKYNWFERADRDSIIKSTLWFTLLYRAASGLDIHLDENVVGKSQTRNS